MFGKKFRNEAKGDIKDFYFADNHILSGGSHILKATKFQAHLHLFIVIIVYIFKFLQTDILHMRINSTSFLLNR